MRRLAAALTLALLAGCGQAKMQAGDQAAVTEAYMDAAPIQATRELAEGGEGAPAGGVQAPRTAEPAPTLYLAYSYALAFELPTENLSALVDRHVQACERAGPRNCQLIGANVSGDPKSQMNGSVTLRGEPAWLDSFMAGLEAQADAAGGRLMGRTTNTDDLTRQIVDTEARQRAQTTLRDRLQELLRNRGGRLSDLLETERELARVQAEIDALQSSLAVMRTRVAMSELTLSYQSASAPLRGDTFRPLGEAFASFLGIVVQGFAAIVYLIAGLVPIAIILIPIAWGLLRWRRMRGGRFFGAKVKSPD